jgi:Protein of unknown function (DUF3592)
MSTRDRGRFVVIGVGAFFAAFGLLFAGIGVANYLGERSEQRRLDAGGKFASALVVRKYIEANATSGQAEPSFRVQFRFAPEGRAEVTGTVVVDPATYRRARPDGRIELVYLPEAPSVHRIEGELRDGLFAPIFAGIGGLFVLIGGGMIYAMLRRPQPHDGAPPSLFARIGIFVTRAPMLLFAGVWLVVGLSFLIAGWFIAAHERGPRAQFATDSVRTSGVVLSKSVVTESSGSGNTRTQTTRYRLTFRYMADDEIVGIANISAGTWERLTERGPVSLTYAARAPWRYRIDGEEGWSDWFVSYILLGVGILATAMGGGALVFTYRGLPSWAHTARWPRLPRRRKQAEEGAPSVPQVALPSRMPRLARAAQYAPRGWFMWVFGAIFFIGGTAAMISGIATLIEEWRYANGSVLAEGRIIGKSIEAASRTERSSTRHVVSYRFTAARGETHEGRHTLSWEVWEAAKEGDRIAVRYLADAPNTNREAGVDETTTGFVTLALGPLLGSIGGGVLFLMYYAHRRRTRLMRDGISVAATVVAVEDSGLAVNKVTQKHIRFRFRDSGGRDRDGFSAPMPPDDAYDWSPGDLGEIRYDAANPDDHIWTGARRAGSAA